MGRSSDLKERYTTMVSLEREEYQDFEKLVGKGNVSKELRAFIKDRVSQQKNEEAQRCDPIGLADLHSNSPARQLASTNTRQSTLFEVFVVKDRRDEIVQFVHSLKDTQELNRLEQNCKCMLKVSETRRKRIVMK